MKSQFKQIYKLTKRHQEKSMFVYVLMFFLTLVFFMFSFSMYEQRLSQNLNSNYQAVLNENIKRSAQTFEALVESDLRVLESLATMIGQSETYDIVYWMEALDDVPLFSKYERFHFMDDLGLCYSTTTRADDVSFCEVAQSVLKGEIYISGRRYDQFSTKQVITFMVPISMNNQVVGGIGIDVDVDAYGGFLTESSRQGKIINFVLDGQGNLVLKGELDDDQLVFESITMVPNLSEESAISLSRALINRSSLQFTMLYQDIEYTYILLPLQLNDWFFLTLLPNVDLQNQQALVNEVILVFSIFTSLVFLAAMITLKFQESRQNRKFIKAAYIDEITQTLNIKGLKLAYEGIVQKQSQTHAMIMLNVDNFKVVNDLFGYEEGNRLIRTISERITTRSTQGQFVGRYYADRFLFITPLKSKEGLERQIDRFFTDLHTYRFPSDTRFRLIFSAGIYIINDTKNPFDMVFDRAIIASNEARQHYESRFVYYDDELRINLINETQLAKEIETAVKKREFVVHLQPRFDVQSTKILGAEALVRWNHSVHGLVYPNNFIKLLEKSREIVDVDMYVLEEVCKVLRRMHDEGYPDVFISVNQSRIHLNDAHYVSDLMSILDRYGISTHQIELELTESILVEDIAMLSQVLADLRCAGFRVSIDDFGSGHSSLNLLKNIEIDVLKLDQKFLRETIQSIKTEHIITSIIEMGKKLDIRVVAEGVETLEQLNFLRRIKCDEAQGYWYSEPLTIEAFLKQFNV